MKIKVSDYVIKFLEERGVDTSFCITGGAAAHLLDSLSKSSMSVIHNYNEQASAMAADGYTRISKKPALVLVTNGPGSSNTITGVIGAWQDSLPMIIISGQVPTHQTISSQEIPLRQLGLQEVDIISLVQNCTNYAVQVKNAKEIPEILNDAWYFANSNRKGPVWIDIPIDIQSDFLDSTDIKTIEYSEEYDEPNIEAVMEYLELAKKPLVIAGNGIHLSNSEKPFLQFIDKFDLPVISTWNASDLFDNNDKNYIGNFGLLGQRAANFAVQSADLILILGSRLSIPCTGYNTKNFARNAKKIMVDIDYNEMSKSTLDIDVKILSDLNIFLKNIMLRSYNENISEWKSQLLAWKNKYSVFDENHTRKENYINSFDFVKKLSACIESKDIIVTDMGTSFTCTMQALVNTGKNRLFTSSGLCSMGFGLPGAIGAYLASKDSRIICIAGDGGFQMNIQELQTIAHYNLPIKIIILNNEGYLAVSLMQDNLFKGNRIGSDKKSGVSSPNFSAIANAYNIPSVRLETQQEIEVSLPTLLKASGPMLIELNMVRDQLLIPRVQSRIDDTGKIISGSLDTMFPFLD